MALTINGERVEESVIQEEAERLRPDHERVFADKEPKEREAQLLEWSKENVIERILLSQEARRRAEEVSAEKVEPVLAEMKKRYCEQTGKQVSIEDETKLREQIELQLRIEQLVESLCKDIPQPSKQDVKKYYEENKKQFETSEQVRVAHIVKHINWLADQSSALKMINEAYDELQKTQPFESVVSKYSDCPDNGGDLGYIKRGQMVEEFEDVVFNLDIGKMSGVFKTRFGFHIAKVYDRKPSSLQPLDKVEKQIAHNLHENLCKDAVDSFLDELRGSAKIEQL